MTQQNWREVVVHRHPQRHPGALLLRLPELLRQLPAERVPANLQEVRRDFFGAHTYERTNKPEGQMFQTDWPEVIG